MERHRLAVGMSSAWTTRGSDRGGEGINPRQTVITKLGPIVRGLRFRMEVSGIFLPQPSPRGNKRTYLCQGGSLADK